MVTSVLSGNRNFEGRISPHVKANYLASPPLVVAYALAGSLNINLRKAPLGKDSEGCPVYLKDIWPSNEEIGRTIKTCLTPQMFVEKYGDVFSGGELWQGIPTKGGQTYNWREQSTYVQRPPYFEGMTLQTAALQDVRGARALAILGDSVTTDHISPAGAIASDSPAAKYLRQRGVDTVDFNSYGSRRGNHQVMMRGTFANIRLRNEIAPGTEGGVTVKWPEGKEQSIFEAAMGYREQKTPLVVVAGSEYGTGSSRDWAAKGTNLLGVVAVMADSFERIHRSNLVGMGVLPLQFTGETTKASLQLRGTEIFDIIGIENLAPRGQVTVRITGGDGGNTRELAMDCRLDTEDEYNYYRHGGILHYVLRNLAGG